MRRERDAGAAVVDFVLVTAVVVPLVLGVIQLGLVLHVRNTLTAAASDGARFAATADHGPTNGAARTRTVVAGIIAGRYAEHVTAQATAVGGYPGVEVRVEAEIPALGLFGPAVAVSARGRRSRNASAHIRHSIGRRRVRAHAVLAPTFDCRRAST